MKTEALRKIAATMREAGVPESRVLETVMTAATVKESDDNKGWKKISLEEFKQKVMD